MERHLSILFIGLKTLRPNFSIPQEGGMTHQIIKPSVYAPGKQCSLKGTNHTLQEPNDLTTLYRITSHS